MDSTDKDTAAEKPTRKSSAERVRKHRQRRQKLDVQIAVGIAKLVIGRGAGDQSKALLTVLEKAARSRDVPDDHLTSLYEAIDKLKSRRFY